ncbi:MAG: hypothetical protein AAGA18_14435 [Verrucomicrobiota bacterium]
MKKLLHTIALLFLTQPLIFSQSSYFESREVIIKQNDPDSWKLIEIDGEFNNPVVIANIRSFNHAEPAFANIRNITPQSFEMQVKEFDYLDGVHTSETVSYLVVEAGSFFLGKIYVEAGFIEGVTDSTKTQVFTADFPEVPIIFTSKVTQNNSNAVFSRSKNVDKDQFKVRLSAEEANLSPLAGERIAYIAVQQGLTQAVDDIEIYATTYHNITNKWHQLNFPFFGVNSFLGSVQTRGGDPSVLRFDHGGTLYTEVSIQEEQSADQETRHREESVGIIAIREALTGHPFSTMMQISASKQTDFGSAFIMDDNTLWIAGANFSGEVGNGKSSGSIYSSVLTPQNTLDNVVSVAQGSNHTLALRPDGSVWVTGSNQYGQCGRTIEGYNDKNLTFKPIANLNNVALISAGMNTTFAVKDDKTLWAMGHNRNSVLGLGRSNSSYDSPQYLLDRVARVDTANTHTLVVKNDGSLWATGYNYYGQLGNDNPNSPVIVESFIFIMNDVADAQAGTNHSLILKTDGTLWTVGRNDYGQLGTGDFQNRSTPTMVMSHVKSISTSSDQSYAILNDNSLWAFGKNPFGALGLGSSLPSLNSPVKAMDDVAKVDSGSAFAVVLKIDGTYWATGRNAYGNFGNGTRTTLAQESFIQIDYSSW